MSGLNVYNIETVEDGQGSPNRSELDGDVNNVENHPNWSGYEIANESLYPWGNDNTPH